MATVQLKRSKPEPDYHCMWELLERKGLLQEATWTTIDELAVEQLYLEGRLTDNDLRSIGAESKITVALKVERYEPNV